MSFDSVFVIGCFLPLTVFLYWLLRKNKLRNGVLLIAGLVFYAFGSLSGLLLLLAAIAVNFCMGLWLQKASKRKLLCGLTVAANLLFLSAYKYLNFLLGADAVSLVAPIGISFFTFKCISYIVDTCRDPAKGTKNIFRFALYVSFFPQITAGPITRFEQFGPQLENSRAMHLPEGLRRFVIGLGKKLILSGTLAQVTDGVFALTAPDVRLAWLGAIAYMLQIYFDFSGYSDMAIGASQMFGFHTPENFHYPYVAGSITDFWRRWHISLSTWFKDYLYIPLGGNRKGKFRAALNKAVVFTLCGLWHGANWTFLVWGAWHGLLSALESIKKVAPKKLPGKILAHIYALLAVCLGFVMFRADTVQQGFAMIGAMFAGFAFHDVNTVALHSLLNAESICILVLGVLLCLPWLQWLKKREALYAKLEPVSWIACLVLFALCLLKLASGGFAPFIYFQF